MDNSDQFFVAVNTPCHGQHSTWVDVVQIIEPEDPSFIQVQTREEYLATGHSNSIGDHIQWVVTLTQIEGGEYDGSQTQLMLTDTTMRNFASIADGYLQLASIERDPKVERRLEDEYAECDG